MQLLLFDFCSWLFNRRLTAIRVALPRDYRLDYRPPGRHRTPTKHDLPPSNDKGDENEDESEDISENEAGE
jgi:hypothetical protein